MALTSQRSGASSSSLPPLEPARFSFARFEINVFDSLRWHNINRHQLTTYHMDAVKCYLKSGTEKTPAVIAAPAASEFAQMWKTLCEGKNVNTIGNRKTASMLWCLFEAVRDRELACLGNALV